MEKKRLQAELLKRPANEDVEKQSAAIKEAHAAELAAYEAQYVKMFTDKGVDIIISSTIAGGNPFKVRTPAGACLAAQCVLTLALVVLFAHAHINMSRR